MTRYPRHHPGLLERYEPKIIFTLHVVYTALKNYANPAHAATAAKAIAGDEPYHPEFKPSRYARFIRRGSGDANTVEDE